MDPTIEKAIAVLETAGYGVVKLPAPESNESDGNYAEWASGVGASHGQDRVRYSPEDHRNSVEEAREVAADLLAAARWATPALTNP